MLTNQRWCTTCDNIALVVAQMIDFASWCYEGCFSFLSTTPSPWLLKIFIVVELLELNSYESNLWSSCHLKNFHCGTRLHLQCTWYSSQPHGFTIYIQMPPPLGSCIICRILTSYLFLSFARCPTEMIVSSVNRFLTCRIKKPSKPTKKSIIELLTLLR